MGINFLVWLAVTAGMTAKAWLYVYAAVNGDY